MTEPLSSPEVPAAPDVREQIKTKASQMLDAMRTRIDQGQRQRVLEMIANESLSSEALTAIDTVLDRVQQEYNKNPTKAVEIMNAMITAGQDGTLSRGEILKLVGGASGTPESMQKIGSMVEKLSATMSGLSDQMGGLGSGTMKMLEGLFGTDSFFGKVFAFLKNTPKAQIAYIEKKLVEQQKTLSGDTDPQQILAVLRAQLIQGQNIERRAKRTPTYDIVQHVEQIMAQINPSKTELTLEDFRTAGEKVIREYPAEVASLPPPPEVAAPATERVRKPVSPSIETAIAGNDATPMRVSRETDGVKFTILGKNATITKIGDTVIASAEVMDATATQSAAVVLTLTDNKKIQINATELKAAATDVTKKTVAARNLTTNSDMTLEVTFA